MPGSRGWGAQTTYGMPVRLHVYDLTPANGVLHPIGFGVYHSGVEVDGEEYTFAQGGGIFSHPPKAAESEQGHLIFRETLDIGTFEGSSHTVKDAVANLRPVFRGDHYHLIKQNCNHFSDRFCQELFPSRDNGIPAYINRVAWIGSFLPCFLPSDEDGQQNNLNAARVKKQDGSGKKETFPGFGHTTGAGAGAGVGVGAGAGGSTVGNRKMNNVTGPEEEVRNRMTEVRRARLKYLNNQQAKVTTSD